MAKPPPYGTGLMDRVARRLDDWAGSLLERLQAFVSRKWPRLGSWLSDD